MRESIRMERQRRMERQDDMFEADIRYCLSSCGCKGLLLTDYCGDLPPCQRCKSAFAKGEPKYEPRTSDNKEHSYTASRA